MPVSIARIIVPVMPQCCYFTARPGEGHHDGGFCGPGGFIQCGAPGRLALLEENDLVCGEYCGVHAELVLDALRAAPDATEWRLIPFVRGNPHDPPPDLTS